MLPEITAQLDFGTSISSCLQIMIGHNFAYSTYYTYLSSILYVELLV